MRRESKIWGERWVVREDSTHMTAYLELLPGYQCSWHVHQQKYNLFVVLRGEVVVEVEEINGERREIWLSKGDSFQVAPGIYHRFKVHEKYAAMIEEMFVKYDEADITRIQLGGNINDKPNN